MHQAEQPVAGLTAIGQLARMTRRADFLSAARGRRRSTAAFNLQARRRDAGEAAAGVRVGITCSKKVGNAVERNRAKRRLREAARLVLPSAGLPGWDYVLIGRERVTAIHRFDLLLGDLHAALRAIHQPPRGG